MPALFSAGTAAVIIGFMPLHVCNIIKVNVFIYNITVKNYRRFPSDKIMQGHNF